MHSRPMGNLIKKEMKEEKKLTFLFFLHTAKQQPSGQLRRKKNVQESEGNTVNNLIFRGYITDVWAKTSARHLLWY